MKIRALLVVAAMSLSLGLAVCVSGTTVDELTMRAVDEDSASSAAAIKELRAMGQTGLDALLTKYKAEIDRYAATGEADADWKRIASAIDTVAMQRDAYASHLYWYTDLAESQKVAKEQHKPVLTLRLLGNLNEEFSCANSRLFRAVLYPNAEVSKYLRDNYILHWKSIRPAPRITIDFGDGRKIERTITGNSIHYILDSDGEVIDAIPGLYSPLAFLKYLQQGNDMNNALKSIPNARHALAMMKYRKTSHDNIVKKRQAALETAKVQMTETKTGTLAILAAPMAMAKAVVVDEYSILRVYDDFAKFEPSVKFEDWNKLAAAYSPNLRMDQNTNAFVRRQNARTGLTEAEFTKLFDKLNSFVALDTTRNDFLFHTKIYQWLNQNRGQESLEDLNSRVYDQIFQTPDYDKWLGLYSNDVYTALDGNGIVK